MKKISIYLLPVLAVAFLAACAGLVAPKSFNDKLAYAYATHTTVLQAATVMVKGGTLTKEEGANVLSWADQARTALDLARSGPVAGATRTPQELLQFASDILNKLSAYLAAKEKK
jgi:hypothetical protein